MGKAYLFSGLGADERVFDFLELDVAEKCCIKWVAPKNGEGLADYSKRIVEEQFSIEKDEPVILIGVSFGGIVASEVSKFVNVEKLIVISSLKSRQEIPLIYRVAGFIKLHFLIPGPLLKSANWLTFWLFGVQKREHRQLLKSIMEQTDVPFFKWAMNEIVNWKNRFIDEKTIHIHGTNDRIIPRRFLGNTIPVLSGGHLMIVTHAKTVEKIINEYLRT